MGSYGPGPRKRWTVCSLMALKWTWSGTRSGRRSPSVLRRGRPSDEGGYAFFSRAQSSAHSCRPRGTRVPRREVLWLVVEAAGAIRSAPDLRAAFAAAVASGRPALLATDTTVLDPIR